MQQLLPRERGNEETLFKQPVKATRTKQAAYLREPAFQAGCRGFEPRLPLSPLQLTPLKALIRLIPRYLF